MLAHPVLRVQFIMASTSGCSVPLGRRRSLPFCMMGSGKSLFKSTLFLST